MKEENKGQLFQRCILNIGMLLLLFIIMDILVTTVLQIINIPMSSANVIISAIITIIIFLLLNRKRLNNKNKIAYLISIIITIFITIISTYIIGKTYDTTCDGNFYHKPAVGLIKEGWNPLYESSEEFCKENDNEIQDKDQFLWMDHYPKVTWNFGASIYAITNNIESGKVIGLLLMISIACLTYAYLSDRLLKKWQAALVALALVVNPITMAQLFTYYVDGIMGLLVYGIILFLIMLSDKKYMQLNEVEKWIGLAAEIILCMNIKFTGIYFAAIFSIVFYSIWVAKCLKEKNRQSDIIKITSKFATIVIVGIVFVGASTYVKNTIDHKNPVYPIIGNDKVDIITTMQPQSYEHKNRVSKLFESIFSVSENITYTSGDSPKLKIPFTMQEKEIENLAIPDTRIGGNGILFSGIFIVSIIAIVYIVIKLIKNKNQELTYILAILSGIVISTIFMAESWWARYSPQIYLIIILAMFGLFYISNIEENKKYKIALNVITTVIFCITILNVSTFVYWRIKDYNTIKSINNSLYTLKETTTASQEKTDIAFNETYYYGILFNIRDYGIHNYNLTDNKENKERYVYNYQIIY